MSERENHLYEFGPFRLDTAEQLLLREGSPVSLSPKAFATLVTLVGNSGKLVEKDELMQRVWPDAVVEENNLNKNISALRKALNGDDSGPGYIETVPKRGYRFTAEVRDLAGVNAELLVEKRTLRRIVAETEEQTDDEMATAQPAQPLAGLKTRSPVISLIAASTLFLAAAAGWLLFFSSRKPAQKPEMTVERLTNGGEIHSAALSPDGKYFVYVEQDGPTSHLWVRQTGQSNPVEIIPPEKHFISDTTFSPDGQFVYFIAKDIRDAQGTLFRVPALGGPQTKLLTNIYSPVTFSPDGQQMAFIRFEDAPNKSLLVIASADDSNERVLLAKEGNEWFAERAPSWSPDGKLIASGLFTGPTPASAKFCSIIGVDVESGATSLLTPQKWDNCGRIAWAGDGRGFVLIGTKQHESDTLRRDQVWYVSQPDGAVQRITTDIYRHNYESLSLTADSSALLVIPFYSFSQIWTMDAQGDSRTAQQLTSGTSDGRAGLAQLPDGRVVFIRRTGDHVDLWQMNADGTGQKQLTSDPPFLEEVQATPDGRYLVFASNLRGHAGESHLFRVNADGTNLLQLTGGESTELDSDISPDGQWIVYESHVASNGEYVASGFWKISIEGGAPVHLMEEDVYTPRFSPDGKYICYVYFDKNKRWHLGIISADDGTPVKTFETDSNLIPGAGCRFTPDGRALTYIVSKKNTNNIWLQPLDGSPPHPLTDFQSGNIYDYIFSRDGSRLLLARGYAVHDVTLIKNFSR